MRAGHAVYTSTHARWESVLNGMCLGQSSETRSAARRYNNNTSVSFRHKHTANRWCAEKKTHRLSVEKRKTWCCLLTRRRMGDTHRSKSALQPPSHLWSGAVNSETVSQSVSSTKGEDKKAAAAAASAAFGASSGCDVIYAHCRFNICAALRSGAEFSKVLKQTARMVSGSQLHRDTDRVCLKCCRIKMNYDKRKRESRYIK